MYEVCELRGKVCPRNSATVTVFALSLIQLRRDFGSKNIYFLRCKLIGESFFE